MTKVYFDSGIFLTPMLKNLANEVVRGCERWIQKAADGEVTAFTSYLTWDEVAWVAGRPRKGLPFDRAKALEASEALLGIPNLRFVPVDAEIVATAAGLLSTLAPRDSIHASTAILHAGGNLVTADSDFFSGLTAALVIHQASAAP